MSHRPQRYCQAAREIAAQFDEAMSVWRPSANVSGAASVPSGFRLSRDPRAARRFRNNLKGPFRSCDL